MPDYITKLVEAYERVLSYSLIQIERGTGINRFFFFIKHHSGYRLHDNK